MNDKNTDSPNEEQELNPETPTETIEPLKPYELDTIPLTQPIPEKRDTFEGSN